MGLTVLVFDVGAGSTSEQLQGALLLAAVGCGVQWSVTQQIRAVDVWRLFPAELTHRHTENRWVVWSLLSCRSFFLC